MEDSIPKARYAVGDLVQCRYAFYQFYLPYCEDDLDEPPYYGVIVEIERAEHEEWPAEQIYVVYCTDNSYRFFVQEEVLKLS